MLCVIMLAKIGHEGGWEKTEVKDERNGYKVKGTDTAEIVDVDNVIRGHGC